MRVALVLLLMAWPAHASFPAMGTVDAIECAAAGGCAWVPLHLIERMVNQNKALLRRYRQLQSTKGCVT